MDRSDVGKSFRPVDHLQFIDALRGWAILGVVLLHTGMCAAPKAGFSRFWTQTISYGQFGVQLFFIVSAFTLFGATKARSRDCRNWIPIFYCRRLFRIAPLFWTAIVFYSLWGWFKGTPRPLIEIIMSFAFMHAWYPPTLGSVVPGGWSIGNEMSFYLILPLLLKTVRTLKAATVLVILSFFFGEISTRLAQPWLYDHFPAAKVAYFNYFWFPRQLTPFALGIWLYFWRTGRAARRAPEPGAPRAPLTLVGAGIAALLAAAGFVVYRGYAAVIPPHVWFSLSFTASIALLAAKDPGRLIINRFIAFLGKISFSIYVIHSFILEVLWNRVLSGVTGLGTLSFYGLSVLMVLSVTTACAAISWRLIEAPWQAIGVRVINRRLMRQPAG